MRRLDVRVANSYALRRQLNPYVLFLGLLAWGALSLGGYSTGKRTFLSDQAFIDAAILYVMRGYPLVLTSGEGGVRSSDAIAYRSVGHFRDINPDCCAFVKGDTEGTGPSPLSYLLGYEWRVVRVSYWVRFRDELGVGRSRRVTEYLMLSRDGKVVWRH